MNDYYFVFMTPIRSRRCSVGILSVRERLRADLHFVSIELAAE